ncbi:MAG: hypothetical protein ACP5QG_08535 [candidate division WOR-3 bacterium]
MEIRTLKCQNCGAPLRVDEGQEHITCPYCGITNIVFEEHLVKDIPGAPRITKSRRAAVLLLVGLGLLILISFFGFVIMDFFR